MKEIEELREKEKEYCRDHIVTFIETYCHYEDKDAPELLQPFKLWPMQKKALVSIHENRLNVLLKARQLGFSWLVMSYATWLMVMFTGRTVIGMSRTEEEAKELVRRMEVELLNMPAFVCPDDKVPNGWTGATYHKNALDITVKVPGKPDSVFKCFPSSPGATRSFTADLIIFDEWAFQQFSEEIWTSAFPVINRQFGGKVIGLSTNNRGSLFEKIFTDKDNGFNKIFIPWYADPRRDKKWYEETKKALGDLITQEYPSTIEEALTVPGGSFFPEVSKITHVDSEPLEGNLIRYVFLDYGLDMLAVHWVQIDVNNHAQIYREYDSPNKTIGEACDIILDMCADEHIELFLAPPDLWSRSQESGKSRAQLFNEGGVPLTKTSNDFAAGCSNMKEWLKVRENGRPNLTILEDSAPNLLNCLEKIQRDKNRPNVYAKEPHDLTHDPDSLRCFCVWWTIAASDTEKSHRKKELPLDYLEDIQNAKPKDREFLMKKYGLI